jgi:hypothetical protein
MSLLRREHTSQWEIAVKMSRTRCELDEPVSDIRGPVEVAIRSIPESAPLPFFESSTVEEWELEFHAWIDGHDQTTQVPSAEALRREALYEE